MLPGNATGGHDLKFYILQTQLVPQLNTSMKDLSQNHPGKEKQGRFNCKQMHGIYPMQPPFDIHANIPYLKHIYTSTAERNKHDAPVYYAPFPLAHNAPLYAVYANKIESGHEALLLSDKGVPTPQRHIKTRQIGHIGVLSCWVCSALIALS